MATHYGYKKRYLYYGQDPHEFRIIDTELSNIKSETILRPINDTTYMGINGGYFDADNGYHSPPTGGKSIAYCPEDVGETVTYGGQTLVKNHHYNGDYFNQVSRKTMAVYSNGSSIVAGAMYAKDKDQVLNYFSNVKTIIGGNDFNESSYSSNAWNLPIPRTVIAWVGTRVHLIICTSGITMPILKEAIEELGFSLFNAVNLDGSGSTSMRVKANGTFSESFDGHDAYDDNRYLFNIIRLKNAY
jgi:hypothetical protein